MQQSAESTVQDTAGCQASWESISHFARRPCDCEAVLQPSAARTRDLAVLKARCGAACHNLGSPCASYVFQTAVLQHTDELLGATEVGKVGTGPADEQAEAGSKS